MSKRTGSTKMALTKAVSGHEHMQRIHMLNDITRECQHIEVIIYIYIYILYYIYNTYVK